MLHEKLKLSITRRLRRIEGQVVGVQKMVDEERYCVDILNQTAAIVSAIRGVENLIMENHLDTCVSDAMRSGDADERRRKVSEVMGIIGKYRKHG
ncbi:MAG: metal-sensitive transcriptional regulator [Spirochaetales bacterium]|nr:metal-sensitive transcriptional regulator [Spirochaetales bacterium]